MKKIIAFAGSNSSTSINHKLIEFVVSQIEELPVRVIRLTDFELPMYGEDIEKEQGFSPNLRNLNEEISGVDALIISVNEHNSGVSAFYKNTMDWLSRLDRDFLKEKKVFVMATSPGGRGAISALEFTKNSLARTGAEVVSSFSLPKFYDNFSEDENRITDNALELIFNDALQNFLRQV